MEKFVSNQKKKRNAKHGFFERAKTHTGKKLLKRRKDAGRKKLTI
jgi:ribosomal protein L34